MKVRVDKWLWCTRIYKTRAKASTACLTGKVKLNGESVKPSKSIKIGDEVEGTTTAFIYHIKVTGLLNKRVGAALVDQYIELLKPITPLKTNYINPFIPEFREPGLGRPTKKDRRDIDKFKDVN